MKTSTCHCHSHTAGACEPGGLEFPRYFARQLLTPAELTLEQQYFRTRLRLHNRFLHGWGVVCGADVCLVAEEPAKSQTRLSPLPPPEPPKPQPWKVRVKPGYILGPFGDEILIDRERVVDLRTQGVSGGCGDHDEPSDPWCAEVFHKRDVARSLYVAVRYKEMRCRPVRVQSAGCGCDDTQCELSRLRDGYEIGVLAECPESHQDPPKLEDLFEGPAPDCPDCPDSPWVVLARVDLDPDGTIKMIDNCSCRRMALSAGTLWWQCTAMRIEILSVTPDLIEVGDTLQVQILASQDLPQDLSVSIGELPVKVISVVNNLLTVEVSALPYPQPGPRTLTIGEPAGCVLAFMPEALTVIVTARPAPRPAAAAQPPGNRKPAAETPEPPKPVRGRGRARKGG